MEAAHWVSRVGGSKRASSVVRAVCAIALIIFLAASPVARAGFATRPLSFWETNGQVQAVLPVGDRVYIGGYFNYVGPHTGAGVELSPVTGGRVGHLAEVNGPVFAAASDGAGGYYIAGAFTRVGNLPRPGLAHVRRGGAVDSRWKPGGVSGGSAANSYVRTLVVSPTVVYVGGNFSSVAGQPRANIAALNRTTGTPTAWNPTADKAVYSLASSGSTVYAGGDFSRIGGQARSNIAALDARTAAATSWDPSADQGVDALAVAGPTVYAGGDFQTVGGRTRHFIAALSARTGAATAWNPRADDRIEALAVTRSRVFAGGIFSRIGGRNRNAIAALSTRTGAATRWNPDVKSEGGAGEVDALVMSGGKVYLGGDFDTVGMSGRANLAAVSARTGAVTGWAPAAGAAVNALALWRSTVYVGGGFTSIGGRSRQAIAALDARTGKATFWDAHVQGETPAVYALAASGSTMYVAGDFSRIGGRTRYNIAALDRAGAATSWKPDADGPVVSLLLSGSTVFAGGGFERIGGRTRAGIAALDRWTGVARAWNARARWRTTTGSVRTMALAGDTLYVGGTFDRIGDRIRNNIAALNVATAAATPWNPNAQPDDVRALLVAGTILYAGGTFNRIGGRERPYLAAISLSTGKPTAWDPGARSYACDPSASDCQSGDPGVYSLALSGSTLYVGGTFTRVGHRARNGLAALNTHTAIAANWMPTAPTPKTEVPPEIDALVVSASGLLAGGQISLPGRLDNTGFAVFPPQSPHRH